MTPLRRICKVMNNEVRLERWCFRHVSWEEEVEFLSVWALLLIPESVVSRHESVENGTTLIKPRARKMTIALSCL